MSQLEKAKLFGDLHVPGNPLILYNIWDAGSAGVIASAGAKAIATGSASVAAAQGFKDGENISQSLVEILVQRIVDCVDLPVTVDFESGYAEEPNVVAENTSRLIELGVVGINFEDQNIADRTIYPAEVQVNRIAAIRQAADRLGIPLFINARTDLFLKQPDRSVHSELIGEALERAAAYKEAGASGFFVPGLVEPGLIKTVCENVSMPVNVMMSKDLPSVSEAASLGVGRVSYGPLPYRMAMKKLTEDYHVALSSE